MNEEEIRQTIAKNIAHYRKALNLTQAEFAEKLKYSDKAISKWERGESLPDVVMMRQLADFFGISLDKLTSVHVYKKVVNIDRKKKKLLIPLLSAGLVWLVATLLFVSFFMFNVGWQESWLLFVYAVPLSFIVLMIFNFIWGSQYFSPIIITVIIWTIAVSLHLSIDFEYNYMVYYLMIPLQILLMLWYIMKTKPRRKK